MGLKIKGIIYIALGLIALAIIIYNPETNFSGKALALPAVCVVCGIINIVRGFKASSISIE